MKNNVLLYNYGQFEFYEDNMKEEREFFYDRKISALALLCIHEPDIVIKNKEEEKQMDKIIKERVFTQSQYWVNEAMGLIIEPWGISFKDLDKNEKNELFKLDFTFDSFKQYAKNYHLKYQKKCKEIIPEVDQCFQDTFFIYFCQLYGKPKITINNILNNIRDYFILEKCPKKYDNYRSSPEDFKKKQDKVNKLYPYLKKKYGINRYFDKFLSYLFKNNDYNNEKTKKILDTYYNQNNQNNQNNDECVNLKDNTD